MIARAREGSDLVRSIFTRYGPEQGLTELTRRLREGTDPRVSWGLHTPLEYVSRDALRTALLDVLVSSPQPEPGVLSPIWALLTELWGPEELSGWVRREWPRLGPDGRVSVVTALHECRSWQSHLPMLRWLAEQEMDTRTRHALCAALAATYQRYPSAELRAILQAALGRLGAYPEREKTRQETLQHFLDGVRRMLDERADEDQE